MVCVHKCTSILHTFMRTPITAHREITKYFCVLYIFIKNFNLKDKSLSVTFYRKNVYVPNIISFFPFLLQFLR